MSGLVGYQALSRLPVGVVIAVQFLGPIGVAIANSRRPRDFLWIGLALAGVWALVWKGIETGSLDPVGLLLACGGACCWATHIVLGRKVSQAFGRATSPLAMSLAAMIVLPVGLAHLDVASVTPHVLATLALVALFSTAIPYALEFYALGSPAAEDLQRGRLHRTRLRRSLGLGDPRRGLVEFADRGPSRRHLRRDRRHLERAEVSEAASDLAPWLKRWSLTPDGEPFITFYTKSRLLAVKRGPTRAMLKLAKSPEEIQGAALMSWWGGQGAARVLEHEGPALLLERAVSGDGLVRLAREGDDDLALDIFCRTVATLHAPRPAPAPELFPLTPWFRSLAAAAGKDARLDAAWKIAQALLAEPRDITVLPATSITRTS